MIEISIVLWTLKWIFLSDVLLLLPSSGKPPKVSQPKTSLSSISHLPDSPPSPACPPASLLHFATATADKELSTLGSRLVVFKKMALKITEQWIRERVKLKHDHLGKIRSINALFSPHSLTALWKIHDLLWWLFKPCFCRAFQWSCVILFALPSLNCISLKGYVYRSIYSECTSFQAAYCFFRCCLST